MTSSLASLRSLAQEFRRKAKIQAMHRDERLKTKWRQGADLCNVESQAYTACAEELERLLREVE